MDITPRVHSIPAPQAVFSGPQAPNVYLVVDGGRGALIDAGYPGEAAVKSRREYLQRMAGLKLSHIIVTHHHVEHCGSTHALRQATGAAICMHPTEARLLGQWRSDAPPDVHIPTEPQTMAERLRAWRRATAGGGLLRGAQCPSPRPLPGQRWASAPQSE
jgi:glyoxylase-like metal-dependent hydrolase (beta-lactamase superfamily II)